MNGEMVKSKILSFLDKIFAFYLLINVFICGCNTCWYEIYMLIYNIYEKKNDNFRDTLYEYANRNGTTKSI